MAAFEKEKVLSVHHWNETLFTFTTTRSASLRFESGHFVMVGAAHYALHAQDQSHLFLNADNHP